MKTAIKTLSALFAIVLMLSSCKKDSQPLTKVEYKVASSGNMNVTYTDQNGATQSATNVSSTWTYAFQTSGHGQTVKLTVSSVNGSTVSGFIYVNGQEAAQNNNSGSATVTAQIP